MATRDPDILGAVTTGTVTTGGTSYYPWPETWTTTPVRTTYIWPAASTDDYANEVEVQRGDHDATLTFYRRRGNSRSHVKTITVPLGVLEWLTAPEG
jgi:hypothetical protein